MKQKVEPKVRSNEHNSPVKGSESTHLESVTDNFSRWFEQLSKWVITSYLRLHNTEVFGATKFKDWLSKILQNYFKIFLTS